MRRVRPSSRLLLVRRVLFEGWSYAEAAEGFAVSVRTVAKWVRRFREGGVAALEDALVAAGRAAAPNAAGAVALIRMLREQHGLPAWAIGRALRIPRSTVECLAAAAGAESARRRRRRCPCSATSGRRPAISSTSTSSPWAASAVSGIGFTAIVGGHARASAGSTCTSRSMITVASPTSRSWPTSSAPPAPRFSSAPWPGLPRAASPSAA